MQKETSIFHPTAIDEAGGRRERRLSNPDAAFVAFLFLASLLLHILTAARTVTFSDSGDFLMAVWSVGNCHGPGYPLYLMTVKVFTLIFPFGSLAFRASLYSGIFASLSICLIYWIVYRLSRSRLGGVVAALAYSFSYTFWYQSVIPETYSLNTFFIALLIVLILRWERLLKEGNRISADNTLALFAFCYGLALANHLTVIFLLPAFVFFAVDTGWRDAFAPRNLLRMAVFFILGLLPYLYQPAAAFRGPAYNYGDPSTLTRWYRHVTLFYQRGGLFKYPYLAYPFRFFRYFGTLTTEFPYFFWLGGLGFVYSFFSNRKKIPLFLTFMFLLSLLPVMTYRQIESVLRAHFYYPSYLIFAIWIGFGAAFLVNAARWLTGKRDRLLELGAVGLIGLIALMCPVSSAVSHYNKIDKSDYPFAYEMARNMLLKAEQDSIILCDSDNVYFPLRYLQVTKQLRSDVRVIVPSSIGAAGFEGLDLLAWAGPPPPSPGEFEVFRRVVEGSYRKSPVYSTAPSYICADWYPVFEGYLLRLYPKEFELSGAQSRIASEHYHWTYDEWSDLDSDAREAVLMPLALSANRQASIGNYDLASAILSANLARFTEETYVPTLYGCATYSDLYDLLGQTLNRNGRFPMTVRLLPEARSINPDFHSANLAAAYLEEDQPAKAVDELTGYLAFEKNNPDAHRQLGVAYFRLRMDEEAAREFSDAIRLNPEDVVARFHYGETLLLLGERERSIEEFRKVAELDPGGRIGTAAEQKLESLLPQ